MKSLLGLLIVVLAGCAAVPGNRLPPLETLFADDSYPRPATLPAAAALFTLSPAMRAHLDSPAFRAQLRNRGKEQGLVAALYDAGELKLEYEATQTRSAAEAYAARRGNCLSLVIMTAAFAKALQLEVRYHHVMVDESWRQSGELVVFSGHVNLSLGRPLLGEKSVGTERVLTVDFLPAADVAGYHSYELPETTIAAMYLNNRAVETMLAGGLDTAYWWARAAVRQDPSFGAAYNTLAVIHRRHGNDPMAERTWRLLLAREPENVVAMRNLAPLLASSGRQAEADQLNRQAAAIEPHPPFYFFQLGVAAMERHDYATARDLFAREVRRAPFHDEFRRWLETASRRLEDSTRGDGVLGRGADRMRSPMCLTQSCSRQQN